jgi:hypothetical protein
MDQLSGRKREQIPREKGIELPWGATFPKSNFFWGKGIKLPWGASSQMFEKKAQGINFVQIKFFYTIRKL